MENPEKELRAWRIVKIVFSYLKMWTIGLLPFVLIGIGTYMIYPPATCLILGLIIWIDLNIPSKKD